MSELGLYYVHGNAISAAGQIGYGRLGIQLARAIEAEGVEVYDHLPKPDDPVSSEGFKSKITGTAMWVSVPGHLDGWWDGQHLAIFTMWEATRLPEGFLENLHHFDTVFVPSQQNLELFSAHHPNVKLVMLGVDPEDWHYVKRQEPTNEFRFLVGGSGPRKGVDLAHRAFLTLWSKEGSWGDGPKPYLILKSPKGDEFYGPRIQGIPGRLSDKEEINLYASAHCYLQPSRGEGFGLQPLQAIAQGLPTILTDAHGHASFAHLGYGIGSELVKANYFTGYGDAGEWWEPDFDDLVERMRWVYDNYAEACKKARDSAQVVAANWTWDRTAKDILSEIPLGEYVGPGGFNQIGEHTAWCKPVGDLFRVRVTKRWMADVAGARLVFDPGIDYWAPADVKRLLFEGGNLDPATMDAEGLSPDEVDRMDGYRWDKSFCPVCDQQLNTGIRKQDVILEQMERDLA